VSDEKSSGGNPPNPLQKLSAAAAELNSASDELGKSIAAADEILKRLNLGVPAWYAFAEDVDDEIRPTTSTRQLLGYARVNNKWGIALSILKEDLVGGRVYRDEEWLFADAPRWLRIKALDHLPKLLERLTEEAEKATGEIREKIKLAQTFAKSLKEHAAADAAARRK
jgi:hypothetical protein